MGQHWLVFGSVFAACIVAELLLGRKVEPQAGGKPFTKEEEAAAKKKTTKFAAIMTAVYVAVAMAFGGYIAVTMGGDSAMEFSTGYVMELALSVDNLFVIALILGVEGFNIPHEKRRKLLFYGLAGAVLLRGLFVFLGIGLINALSWLLPAMGVLLLFLGLKIGFEEQIDAFKERRREKRGLPEKDETPFMVGLLQKWGVSTFIGALLAVEVSDLIFAVDSVPVILAITQEPLIALSASMLAVVGLRSLYFLLEGAQDRFEYLPKALGVILAFIGVKLVLLLWHIHLPMPLALVVTVSLLAGAIGASLVKERQSNKA